LGKEFISIIGKYSKRDSARFLWLD
jgi:hypothetical protein